MFRTGFLSIIRSLVLYIQQQVYVIQVLLSASNQRDALNSQIYFWNRTLHVLDRFSVHHQESSTVYTAIGICHTGFADCQQAVNKTCMTYTYCCVYSTRLLMMDRKPVQNMQSSIPKHLEHYSKNKFEKLVHLVGFITRI